MLLLRHRDTGNPKGAFVEFASAGEVGAALDRNGMVRLNQISQDSPTIHLSCDWGTSLAAHPMQLRHLLSNSS